MNPAATIDLNVDFGESDNPSPSPAELEILATASSINLSCGVHAGNTALLRAILVEAAAIPIAVGAHPSYDDRPGFGRKETGLEAAAIEPLVATQVAALAALAHAAGARIRYIKAHGALYHRTARDPVAAAALCRAARRASSECGPGVAPDSVALPVLGPAGGALETAARDAGVPFFREGFLDRGYRPDGTLVPRGERGAMITDTGVCASRAVAIALGRPVAALDGSPLTVAADSLCVHGDSATALEQLQIVRAALRNAGVEVRSFAP